MHVRIWSIFWRAEKGDRIGEDRREKMIGDGDWSSVLSIQGLTFPIVLPSLLEAKGSLVLHSSS